MKKIIILLFLLFVPTSSSANENTASWNLLKNGGKIVWIRHAITTPSCCGDPDNLKINDRSTQRNLGNEGIKQSKKIGHMFKKIVFRLIKC
jgi:hypothetical protein